MTPSKIDKFRKTAIADMRKWMKSDSRYYKTHDPTATLRTYLQNRDPKIGISLAWDCGTCWMRCLERYILFRLVRRAANWEELHLAGRWYRLTALATCLVSAPLFSRGYGLLPKESAAMAIAVAVILGEAETARWLSLQLAARGKSELYERTSRFSPNQGFVACLAQLAAGSTGMASRLARLIPKNMVQRRIIDHWGEWQDLEGDIRELCDYHAQNMKWVEPRGGEFSSSESIIFPAEILALKCVVSRSGFEFPDVDHPLLRDCRLFESPPERIPIASNRESKLLDRAEEELVPKDWMKKSIARMSAQFERSPPPRSVSTKKPRRRTRCTLAEFEARLLEDPETVIHSGHFAIIDWKNDLPGMMEIVEDAVASGGETWGWDVDGDNVMVTFSFLGRSTRARLTVPKKGPIGVVRTMMAVREALRPDWDMKVLSSTTGGDTWVFIMKPAAWFAEFAKRHPKESKKLFWALEKA